MERHRSIGNTQGDPWLLCWPMADVQGRGGEPRGSVVNYPGNPCFRPRFAFKMAETSKDMEQRSVMLTDHVVVITEEGPMEVQSCEEVKDILLHHIGIRKHECYICHSYPEPFIVIFPDSHNHNVVFAAANVVDGLVELAFYAWDLDRFGDRDNISYLVRLSLEGVPHHAWFKEVTYKVLCDEALIHFVEEDTMDRTDLRAYRYWAFCKDPYRLPPDVFLTLAKHEQNPRTMCRSTSSGLGGLNRDMYLKC
jgi:hypothetical protein